ncbi:hypothetical protein OSB04_025021 [Centaurea solstitialis]|uniref:G-patch domain-containing protein n=1 Tax=Centaurea solstitialis TaxID=347529 RepID=A0AA38WCN3_9ASTR|nr:hypothetical protein OSB04_025021 [Centaurea solstitialis]
MHRPEPPSCHETESWSQSCGLCHGPKARRRSQEESGGDQNGFGICVGKRRQQNPQSAISQLKNPKSDDLCGGRYVYIDDLPARFNEDMIKECISINKWFAMCNLVTSFGLGPPLENNELKPLVLLSRQSTLSAFFQLRFRPIRSFCVESRQTYRPSSPIVASENQLIIGFKRDTNGGEVLLLAKQVIRRRMYNSVDCKRGYEITVAQKEKTMGATKRHNQVCVDIGRLFFESGIPFSCAKSLSFDQCVELDCKLWSRISSSKNARYEDLDLERRTKDNIHNRFGMEDNYGERNEKRHQTKDDVLYGVFTFGNTDSDSDDGGFSKKKQKKDLSRKQGRTKPLSFVSSGVVMPSEEIDKSAKEENKKDDQDDGSRSGSGRRDAKADGNVGVFEKHTKGIGLKLLEKWGYKGGGLGRNAQGIVAPIEAKLRPKNMGMGFNDYKEAAKYGNGIQRLSEEDTFLPQPAVIQPKEKLRSKYNRSKKKKKKDYVTAEELLIKKQEQGLDVVQKVIDMRGPQVHVLTNLANLNAEENSRENWNADLTELDIQKSDCDLRNERETGVTLEKTEGEA